MCPGFDSNSRTRRHMWVEFVVGSLLCSERFFSGYSGFPLSSKTNTTKFQFDLETVDEEPPRGNATANPIIIIIIINSNSRIPLKLMKEILIIVCDRSIRVSCDVRRSDVGIYVANGIKPVTGILSTMTASVSFQ